MNIHSFRIYLALCLLAVTAGCGMNLDILYHDPEFTYENLKADVTGLSGVLYPGHTSEGKLHRNSYLSIIFSEEIKTECTSVRTVSYIAINKRIGADKFQNLIDKIQIMDGDLNAKSRIEKYPFRYLLICTFLKDQPIKKPLVINEAGDPDWSRGYRAYRIVEFEYLVYDIDEDKRVFHARTKKSHPPGFWHQLMTTRHEEKPPRFIDIAAEHFAEICGLLCD